MDCSYMRLQCLILTGGPSGCQFATAPSDQVRIIGTTFPSVHDMPACPVLTCIDGSRQPEAALCGTPKRIERATRIPSNGLHPSRNHIVRVRTPIPLSWRG